jgi:ABC-2 type transport system permease protein
MNKSSLYQLILVHFKTFFREPAILFWAILFPILMAWVLGIAFSNKRETLKTVYVIGDKPVSEKITGEKIFSRESGNPFKITFKGSGEREAVKAIKRGIISLYIETKEDSLIYHFDPANPDARLTHLIIDRELSGSKASLSSIRILESKGTRYIDFLIPGLIALGIMNSCIWGIGWTLIETRMKKLLRRMVATPMKKSVFLGSHVITRLILGGIETALLFIFSYFYFGTSITGSVPAFLAVFFAGVIAFSGIGILIASRTDKSEIGNGLVNAVTLSMTILSGVFFNYHNFPDWAISFIQLLPLTLLADVLRAIFIEAAGFQEVIKPVVILLLTGAITFTAGMRIFKWY